MSPLPFPSRWRSRWRDRQPAAGEQPDPAPPPMPAEVQALAGAAKGFLAEPEGLQLFELAAAASRRAPCLEVGSYCGKSTLYLAAGCRAGGRYPLFAVDHHRGSAEQQPGEEYYDPDLADPESGGVDTLSELVRTVRRAGLAEWVVPIVTSSTTLSRLWPNLDLALVFIDGGHGTEDVFADYHGWAPKLVRGGYLCVHDLHPDPETGGQAPYRMFRYALESGGWQELPGVGTLGILRRQ